MINFIYKRKDPAEEEAKLYNLQLLSLIRQKQLEDAQGKEADREMLALPGKTETVETPGFLPSANMGGVTAENAAAIAPGTREVTAPGKTFPITRKDFSSRANEYLPWMTKEDRQALGFAEQREKEDEPYEMFIPGLGTVTTTRQRVISAVSDAARTGQAIITPEKQPRGQTPVEGLPPPASGSAASALPFPFITGGKKAEQPKRYVINGQLVEEQAGGGFTPVFGEAKPTANKAPTTRQLTQGDSVIEQEWDGDKWVNVGGGPRYKPMAQGPSPTDVRHTSTSLRKEFNALQPVKDYRDMENKFNVMQKAAEESTKTNNYVAVDQALVTLFNKMTDPQSVVRESEYVRTPQDMAVMDRLKAAVIRVGKGGRLEANTRQALMTMAGKFREAYSSKFLELADEYRGYATGYGIDPNLVVDIKRYQKPAKQEQAQAPTTKRFTIIQVK